MNIEIKVNRTNAKSVQYFNLKLISDSNNCYWWETIYLVRDLDVFFDGVRRKVNSLTIDGYPPDIYGVISFEFYESDLHFLNSGLFIIEDYENRTLQLFSNRDECEKKYKEVAITNKAGIVGIDIKTDLMIRMSLRTYKC